MEQLMDIDNQDNSKPKRRRSVTKLRARRDEIRVYITRLQEEKEKWDQMMENYKHRCQKAIDLADQLIEPPASRKAPLSELMETEAIQSPRYILNRVLKAFHNRNKSTETVGFLKANNNYTIKKIIDDMEVEANLVLEVLSKKIINIKYL
uniref:Uncharacterized protein n=1 Tax=Heterorhabditis bacteriophora TaxID=37862 RepID=A0A1I7WYC1_HETBA